MSAVRMGRAATGTASAMQAARTETGGHTRPRCLLSCIITTHGVGVSGCGSVKRGSSSIYQTCSLQEPESTAAP